MTTTDKWLTLGLLCLSGSMIYWLPFFSEIFHTPMEDAFGFSDTQIGILLSTFGAVSMIAYFPGGWLADRISPRKLIPTALLVTAIGGFVFSTLPSFQICLILYGTWGVSTAFIFWSAMIKTIRNWGASDEQGRAYGFLEGGRNIGDMVTTTTFVAIFAFRGSSASSLSEVMILISCSCLVLAFLSWRIMSNEISREKHDPTQKPIVTLGAIIETLKLPSVWLIGIVIMAAYSGMWGTIFFTPYADEIYELGDIGGGAIGAGKYYITPVAAIAAGFFADKIGPAKAVLWFFVIMTASFLIFGLIPGGPNLVPLLIINGGLLAAVAFALRGIYFSLVEQGGIPLAVTGTATGVVSVIGYTPDIFLPTLKGIIIDTYPGTIGYQYLFLLISALSFLGLVAAFMIYRKTRS